MVQEITANVICVFAEATLAPRGIPVQHHSREHVNSACQTVKTTSRPEGITPTKLVAVVVAVARSEESALVSPDRDKVFFSLRRRINVSGKPGQLRIWIVRAN